MQGVNLVDSDAKWEAAMCLEGAAFRDLHPALYKKYAGKYVAIYNEQLVDSDSDQATLLLRTRKQYPNEFVWIAPVSESPDEVFVFRSPRLLRKSMMNTATDIIIRIRENG